MELPSEPGTAPGVIHLGLGAFHRAHQALVFDTLLRSGDRRWGVLGVAMRNPALAEALQAQDGLYSVQVASATGTTWRVPGALWGTAVAAQQREQVVSALAATSTRWVTLTVTEKGYGPELAGLLVEGLARRHTAGHAGLTLASCDNLSGNGRRLQALCEEAARTSGHGPALLDWMARHCAFPNSMVDRIVPAATEAHRAAARAALGMDDAAALGTEGFWEWVLERHLAAPADADLLASAGVTLVDDVHPFEEAKLRLLNGSHSAMACIGTVAGLPFIADCIQQPAVRRYIHGLMTDEVGPHVARTDWPAYRDALITRFANPALRHSVHQIATDSTQKIPQRWVPATLTRWHQGLPFARLAFAAAAWMRHARGQDDTGQPYALSDPLAEMVTTLARRHAGDATATVAALGGLEAIWGTELPHLAPWRDAVAQALHRINTLGLLAALEQENPAP